MIRVGFIGDISKEWMGGLNYLKNLLYAISIEESQNIEVFMFVGKNMDREVKEMFEPYATIIEDSLFDASSLKSLMSKIGYKMFQTNFYLKNILNQYEIQVLSHSNIVNVSPVKTINWIPDFQHLHLPSMFSSKDIIYRKKSHKYLIEKSDCIVVSSYDALNDLSNFTPGYSEKASVLQFVSQPDNGYFRLGTEDKVKLLDRYKIEEDFFYLPNQFWKHKNHMVVFEAIKLLAKEKQSISVVCSGHMNDHRNKTHVENLKLFIEDNHLQKHIKLLGLVPYEDVFALMKFSKAVINPSLFEGWSSTVEECKSVGKSMILSNLNVHREQYPEATFFDKSSPESLMKVLQCYHVSDKISAQDDLRERTKKYAKDYLHILEKVLYVR